jgi:hypothetical protein
MQSLWKARVNAACHGNLENTPTAVQHEGRVNAACHGNLEDTTTAVQHLGRLAGILRSSRYYMLHLYHGSKIFHSD